MKSSAKWWRWALASQASTRSVANLAREDGGDFLRLAAQTRLRVHATAYPLTDANRALDDLRQGRITGAAVLLPHGAESA